MTLPPDIEILARLNFARTPAFAKDNPDEMDARTGKPAFHWFIGDAERDALFLKLVGWELRRVGS